MEIWKDINEHYQISNIGRIRNKHTLDILKPSKNKHGYKHIKLCYGLNKEFPIHRLVAKAFIANPNNYNVVNHKDENKSNNCADNLEWCTTKYNINYGKGSLVRNQKIIQYDMKGNAIKIWESMKDACNELGLNYKGISSCCRGKNKSCGGYVWTYANIIDIKKRWNRKTQF